MIIFHKHFKLKSAIKHVTKITFVERYMKGKWGVHHVINQPALPPFQYPDVSFGNPVNNSV